MPAAGPAGPPDPVAELAAAVLRDLGSEVAAEWRYTGLEEVPDREADTERWACFDAATDPGDGARIWLADPADRTAVLDKLAWTSRTSSWSPASRGAARCPRATGTPGTR